MEQPCLYCTKYSGGCSWTEVLPNNRIRFEPVPGWVAVPQLKNPGSERIETYRIISCPEFDDDGSRQRTIERERNEWPRTYRGETRPVSEWAKIKGMSLNTLNYRLQRGWTLQQALDTPIKRKDGTHG